MNQEQSENASKLEQIRSELWKQADLYNKAGYKPSAYELHLLDNIQGLIEACQKLARQ